MAKKQKTQKENHEMGKILVVDDDESILDAISLILEEDGYQVTTTAKGQEVFKKVKDERPELILLDVLLSGMDGREICKTLKTDPKTKNIPIVMISAHPTASKSAKASGADHFLPKPFGMEELLTTVNKFLN